MALNSHMPRVRTGKQMTSPSILRVHELTRDFGGIRAVDRCTFEVRRGSITGLIGPNGAGKSTLFNLITGFLVPDSGRVFFRGDDITGLPPHRIFQRGLCRTFQIPREHRSMTVLENLMLVPPYQIGERLWNPWLRPRAVRRQEEEIRERALRVLELVDLAPLQDQLAGNLSGGQRKLLELARTMMADPEMILLDEPGAGVNPTLMRRLTQVIERLRHERGITFLIIEHDLDLVTRLCDTVIVMSEGAKLAEGPPDAVRRDPRVVEAYLGGQYATAGK